MNKRKIVTAIIILIIMTSIIIYLQLFKNDKQQTEEIEVKIEWEEILGGENNDRGSFIYNTADGGFLTLGYTETKDNEDKDIWLIKFDQAKKEIWNEQYGSSYDETGNAIIETDDGYLITGLRESFGSANDEAWLIKIDKSGNHIWNKTYGDNGWDEFNSIAETYDGNYVIVGSTTSFGSEGYDIWSMKIDESGNEIWNKTYGGSKIDTGRIVLQSVDEGYIIFGGSNSYSSGDNTNIWMIKIDESGDEVWNKTLSSDVRQLCNAVVNGVDNGFIIAGHTYVSGEDIWNGLVIKTDEQGVKKWETLLELDDKDAGISSVEQTEDGYIAVGYTGLGDEQDGFVAKIGLSGDVVWKDDIKKDYMNGAVWVEKSDDDKFYITGYCDILNTGFYDLWVFQIDF